jgi:hypothetical protein
MILKNTSSKSLKSDTYQFLGGSDQPINLSELSAYIKYRLLIEKFLCRS